MRVSWIRACMKENSKLQSQTSGQCCVAGGGVCNFPPPVQEIVILSGTPPRCPLQSLLMSTLDVMCRVAGAFALAACAYSVWLIWKHLQNYTHPDLQRYIVRILWMVPVSGMNF